MPFLGNAANSGSEQIGVSGTTRNNSFLLLANGATDQTKAIDLSGLSRLTIMCNQSAGAPGTFQVLYRTQGDAPNIPMPVVAIAGINQPVLVTFPIYARACIVRVFAPAAGGPHSFQVVAMGAAAA